MPTQGVTSVADAVPMGVSLSPSRDWASSSLAFAISCGSCDASPSASSGGPPLYRHALVPICLSTLGKPVDPRTFLQVLPGYTRDATEHLTAHTVRARCPRTRLSSDSVRLRLLKRLRGSSPMDGYVTCAADKQRLAVTRCHDAHPSWSWRAALWREIGEFTHVMDLHLFRCATELAPVRQEPTNQFIAFRCVTNGGWKVQQDGVLLSSQRSLTEARTAAVAPLARPGPLNTSVYLSALRRSR